MWLLTHDRRSKCSRLEVWSVETVDKSSNDYCGWEMTSRKVSDIID